MFKVKSKEEAQSDFDEAVHNNRSAGQVLSLVVMFVSGKKIVKQDYLLQDEIISLRVVIRLNVVSEHS